jgi:hypothetical protein
MKTVIFLWCLFFGFLSVLGGLYYIDHPKTFSPYILIVFTVIQYTCILALYFYDNLFKEKPNIDN